MSTDPIEAALSQLFVAREWSVPAEIPTTLREADFIFSAENDVAVVVATVAGGAELREVATHASAAIGALSQAYEGPKAWEVYLLLAVHDLGNVEEDTLIYIQRDLLFCRKLILDAEELTGSPDAVNYLERKLSLLFPLSRIDTEAGPDPRELLEQSLIQKGHAGHVVRTLMDGVDESGFDPMAFLLSELTDRS